VSKRVARGLEICYIWPMAESRQKLRLHVLEEKFAVSKLPQFAELPHIFTKGENCFVARTDNELSIICPEFMAPTNVQQEGGWRCIQVMGEMPLSEVGVLASLTAPLAKAGIPILAISTFDTDYLFVMEENLIPAVQAIQKAGHEFVHTVS
jgi:hypothetical protein